VPAADEVPEPVLGVAAVARRLGVATGTLRTWDRRYGIGPSAHASGSRRRYTGRDLARLEVMRRMMLEGVAPSEAARVALGSDLSDADPSVPPATSTTPRGRRTGRPGGGRVVPLRDASPAARGLARAAMSLDSDACTDMLVTAVRRRGVLVTWEDVLRPVLAGVGERWRSTGAGVEVEHLLSESAEVALRSVRARQPPPGVRPVVLTALNPEDHRLPLVALASALAERAVPVRMLGVRLPVRALADAVARTGPSAVFLWSQGAGGPAVLPPLEGWAAVRPRPEVLLGGPGWEHERWNPAVTWAGDLAEAAGRIESLASSPHGATGGSR
jgi:transposase-like protein